MEFDSNGDTSLYKAYNAYNNYAINNFISPSFRDAEIFR